MRARRPVQLRLPEPCRWGGKRQGAGRKLVRGRPTPPHRTRPPHVEQHPVLVTLRARDEVNCMRNDDVCAALERALSRAHKPWFRVRMYSVQTDHIHLVVEADSRLGLIRGVQGLAVRCAKALNKAVGRKGAVWDHRYHARRLKSPREVRMAFLYVLLNFRKHHRAAPGIDPRSSGRFFEGWKQPPRPPPEPPTVAPARTWLARVGWLRAGGPIDPAEWPRHR